MYLKEIEIENIGPIGHLKKTLSFKEDKNPKPLLIIGRNGSGKSIFISHIINALISAKQVIYDDFEVEENKVYKYRSPGYIKSGENYSYSNLTFENDFSINEWQLITSRKKYEEHFKSIPNHKSWSKIEQNESALFETNFATKRNDLKKLIDSNCLLFFPPNRFEEPAWLNYDNLINKADYRNLHRTSNISNRQIINYSPLKDNQNWLLDILFDKFTLEIQTSNVTLPINDPNNNKINIPFPMFQGYSGESNNIHTAILKFLGSLFQTQGKLRFGVGKRRARTISIMKNEQSWIPNIFNLSTGETGLLNIFLTIIKDFDLSRANFTTLAEIRGIVVIDEIEMHLHSNLQYEVLPRLIKLFPKIQFVISTHSPLFLLGMRNEFGSENFDLINLPNGENIGVEHFSEFEKAYSYIKKSLKYQEDLEESIAKTRKSFLFLEGVLDIRYIQKAAKLFNKENLLDSYRLVDSNGFGGIDRVYKHFDSKLSEITPQKMVLLYDCDTNKSPSQKGNVYKRIIPRIEENPLNEGIENLFSRQTIEKAIQNKKEYIDITESFNKTVRGKKVSISEEWKINPDEKSNLCDWLILNGAKDDFKHFEKIFDIIEQLENAT